MTIEQNQSPLKDEEEEGPAFTVRRGTINSVEFYEINDYELSVFEQGGIGSVALNFAIFLFSVAFSAIVVITTVDLSSNDRLYFSFFIVGVIGIVLGIFMLINWWRGYLSVKALCKKVRARIATE